MKGTIFKMMTARLSKFAFALLLSVGTTHLFATSATSAAAPSGDVRVRPEELLIPVKNVNALVRGMTAEQVTQLLGKPTRVATVPDAAVKSEIWTYRISVKQSTDQVATSMRDVSVFDPLTNDIKTIKEPVFQLQYTHTYTTLELLMVDGKLIERKGGREIDRSFY